MISGKSGTGKTTIVAAFASLAKNATFADCDCDAPDLPLILKPEIVEEEEYIGSEVAVREVECSRCGKCRQACRFDAIDEEIRIIGTKCEGCGACAFVCPEGAIVMRKGRADTIYSSKTRFGPMIHAELGVGGEAYGKLVAQVREKAQDMANDDDLIIIDGCPGIGCPLIASITGVDAVLVVAEPTVTGLHDMGRALEVVKHFGIPASVYINKHDINEEKTKEIEEFCLVQAVPVLGKLPYDDVATKAMINEQTVIEHSNSELSKGLKETWEKIESSLIGGGE